MFDVKEVTYIKSSLELRGSLPQEQAEGDCARRIIQWWSKKGELIMEYDPYLKTSKIFREDLL